ncbi:hypothetical protein [Microbacterium panaciterrae]|uniref:Uncharacterized protein n=1 Tax=Microbacterium panaciterrae TaxID=985759 RepID=A0ABP8P6E2_9MICO
MTTVNETHHDTHHTVTVPFNRKPIRLEQRAYSGLELKQEAIRQGVDIRLDYILFELKHNGRREIIADREHVQVNKESAFVANSGDDNS